VPTGGCVGPEKAIGANIAANIKANGINASKLFFIAASTNETINETTNNQLFQTTSMKANDR